MTARHSAAVARYARALAREAGCAEAEQELVHTAGLLHDIGKFIFPDRILLADTRLSDEDWEIVKCHPYQGAKIVRNVEGYGPVADIILGHHERVDGKGYPRGICGDQIPLLSRMISIADTYDVMTSRDSYRTPVTRAEAVAELRRVAGAQLDAHLVGLFVAIVERERRRVPPRRRRGLPRRAGLRAPRHRVRRAPSRGAGSVGSGRVSGHELLARHDVEVVRADNPSPYTLEGTNTWLVGRDPCWVVDPGPEMPEHADAVAAAAEARGGVGGIALTHGHLDHAGGVGPLRARTGAPAPAQRHDGDVLGPLRVLATGGHSPDHVAFVAGSLAFTGDAVLGRGSVFVAPGPGSLRGYLAALEALRALDLEALCPGHGPLVTDPATRLGSYVEHRLEREAALRAALDDGLRGVDELLDRVWADAPAQLRMAATITLAAHLGKLEEEGGMPDGVERPVLPRLPTV
jgi:putative nucleotidyltransferase with HDIG domain